MRYEAVLAAVEGLSKEYGSVRALSEVSLRVHPGSVHVILGKNGAGKTTMMEIASSLREPDDGDVFFNGVSVRRNPEEAKAYISVLLDISRPFRPTWTVEEYLAFFQSVEGRARPETRYLDRLGLSDLRRRVTGSLSRGQWRRTELARVLSSGAPFLILDEPTKEIDLDTTREIWSLFQEERSNGRTILLSTHNASEIRELASRVTVLRDGRISDDFLSEELARLDGPAMEEKLRGAMTE